MAKLVFDDPKQEAVKEFLRGFLIAVIPVLTAYLQPFIDKTLWAAIGIVFLKSLDKYLYVDKSTNPVTDFLKLEGVK